MKPSREQNPHVRHLFDAAPSHMELSDSVSVEAALRKAFGAELMNGHPPVLDYALVPPGTTAEAHGPTGQDGGEVYVVLEGSGCVLVGDDRLPVRAGDAILLNPANTYAIYNNSDCDIRLLVARPASDGPGSSRAQPHEAVIGALSTTENISYPVVQSYDLFSLSNETLSGLVGDRSFLLFASPAIDRFYGERIRSYLSCHFAAGQGMSFVISTGEANKTIENVSRLCELAQQWGLDRKGIFIGVGGGVTLDIVSFAASMFRRRTDCVKIGTTLLAQIDAAIGVKCGINFQGSKNLLGAFYPPRTVVTDPKFLSTLPERHIRSGLAEIIKLGIIKDRRLFELVERNYRPFLERRVTDQALLGIIKLSTVSMIEELADNLYENVLVRPADFGHTFCHHLESASHYAISHGEAVSLDMALTCVMAGRMGYLAPPELERILAVMRRMGLPVYHKLLDPPTLFSALEGICLHRGKMLNMPVPTSIGAGAFIEHPAAVTLPLLRESVEYLQALDRQPFDRQ